MHAQIAMPYMQSIFDNIYDFGRCQYGFPLVYQAQMGYSHGGGTYAYFPGGGPPCYSGGSPPDDGPPGGVNMDHIEVLLVKPFLKGALQLMAPGDGSPPEDCDLPYDGNGRR